MELFIFAATKGVLWIIKLQLIFLADLIESVIEKFNKQNIE